MRTVNLTTASTEFNPMVESELQNMERLMGTVRTYDSVGESMVLPKIGSIDMQQTAESPAEMTAGDIPVQDFDQAKIIFIPGGFKVKTVLSEEYATLFNYDILSARARQQAKAIGRFNDYMALRPALAGTYNAGNKNLVVQSVGGNTNLNVDKIAQAKFQLNANGVDDSNISLWTNASTMAGLLKDQRYSNFFYANQKAYTIGGQQSPILGVDIRTLSEISANGKVNNLIPIAADGTTAAYMVWYDAIGINYNRRPTSKIVTVEDQDRVEILTVATADSQVIHLGGIIKIECKIGVA